MRSGRMVLIIGVDDVSIDRHFGFDERVDGEWQHDGIANKIGERGLNKEILS